MVGSQYKMHLDCIVCSERAGVVLAVAVESDRCSVVVEHEGVDVNGRCRLEKKIKTS